MPAEGHVRRRDPPERHRQGPAHGAPLSQDPLGAREHVNKRRYAGRAWPSRSRPHRPHASPRPPSPGCRSTCAACSRCQHDRAHHDLVGAPGRAGRRQRRQGAQGPLLPRLLRHPGRRLRRRVPAVPDEPRARASPRTGPSSSSGVGNLGQALANYGGFGDRGFPVAALVDADPREGRHRRSHGIDGAPHRRPARRRRRARHRHRHHRHAGRRPPRTWPTGWSPPASPSILNFAPTVISVPAERLAAQGRPRRRAADPQLLPAAPERPVRPSPPLGRRRRAAPTEATMPVDAPAYPVNLLVAGRRVPRGRRRRGGGRARCAACSPPARVVHVVAPEVGDRGARALDGHLGGAPLPAGRGRRLPAGRRLHRRPGGQPGGVRRRRGGRRVGQRRRRPGALLLHAARPARPGPAARHRVHRRATARRWPRGCATSSPTQLGPGVRHAHRPARRGPGRAASPRVARPPAPIGDRPSIRECWTSSGPVGSTRPGSCSAPPSPRRAALTERR